MTTHNQSQNPDENQNASNPPNENKPNPTPVTNVSDTFKMGLRIREFLASRPGIPFDEVFKALVLVFPEDAHKYTNEQLIIKYGKSKEYRAKIETMKQYGHHLAKFSDYIGKAFRDATPVEIERYIKDKTVIKHDHKEDDVKGSTHDHIIDVLRTFYGWMRSHGYYSRLLDNPVQVLRIGKRRLTPDETAIFSASELQRLYNALPFHAIPAAVCLFELGIRPGTLLRLSWSDFDWKRGYVNVSALINKAGGAKPVLTPAIRAKLAPWRKCTGPIVLLADTLKVTRQIIKKVLGRIEYSNDARKTAISMRAAVLLKQDAKNCQARLSQEFGNSPAVRDHHYWVLRTPAEAKAYFATTIKVVAATITATAARALREAQFRSAGRVAMAISEAMRHYTHTSPKAKVDMLRRKAIQKARETLAQVALLPSFVKVIGEWVLSERQRKALAQKAQSAEQARALEALQEQYAHEKHQMSLYHGRPDLLQGPAISPACPTDTPNPTTNPKDSSTNDSSPSATE
jgi:hypothetical protein